MHPSTKEVLQITYPTGKLLVVDPGKLGVALEPASIVGTMDYPLDFCPVDIEGHCDNPFRADGLIFKREESNGWRVHTGCGRPTRRWWEYKFTDIVDVTTHSNLPWQKPPAD